MTNINPTPRLFARWKPPQQIDNEIIPGYWNAFTVPFNGAIEYVPAAEIKELREKLRRYQLYYEHVDGYEKLVAEFGECEHPESSVWITEWLDKVLMRVQEPQS